MRGALKLTWVEIKLFMREPLAAFFTLLFPLLLLVIFGSIFENVPTYSGFGFIDVAVPGYAVIVIGTSGLLSLSTNLAVYRDIGVLRRLRLTPLRPLAILLAQAAVMFMMTLLGMILLVGVGSAMFGLRCAGAPLVIASAFTLCCAALFALGFLLASVVPTARSAQAVGLAAFYPMIFLSGAAIPRELLPERVRRAAIVLPMTHAVSLLQGLWMGERWTSHGTDIVVLAAVAVSAAAIAVRLFRWE